MPLGGCLAPALQGISPLRQRILLSVFCSASTALVFHVCHHSVTLGFLSVHAAADARSAGWVELDVLLSHGCCLLDNYFPLCCTSLQVLEGVCAEQVCL